MKNSQTPVARKEGLVIQEMPDEVLVYDLDDNKAFCLNPTAADIWKSCDGTKTVAQIASGLKGGNGQASNEEVVWLALDQLKEKNLLKEDISLSFNGQSRREMIKKVGLATAIALPVIAMLSFPGQTLAATCAQSACGSSGVGAGCQPGETCCLSTINPGTYECFPNILSQACGVLAGTASCP